MNPVIEQSNYLPNGAAYVIKKNGDSRILNTHENGMPIRLSSLLTGQRVPHSSSSSTVPQNNSNAYATYGGQNVINLVGSDVMPRSTRESIPATGRFFSPPNHSARPSLCPICDHVCIHNQNTSETFISTSM